ncbi:hypothetical protein Kpol_538p49 [Vanderwaltozyma polyspora DSM 70294]|uniref:Uncharacterized protein n=1 Tax=Vanderwaltozyma polyspora (strain ATCC 22028 / DSM 70294 / BCRC 21397 / CBS 2163 / NBRC 10782 / NRRL Y-8283 / UCD 57-17) TaxID=436907 RepID=A7TKG2_VANPO|nr:uncharacterized protein Kpol_538p49 [Vanderwaltozyma polyspora DSM 70294]EDO17289.1 hypothetical protein Kpol_538p49 [Vanderwaltozyma polyspora DSM 70294]
MGVLSVYINVVLLLCTFWLNPVSSKGLSYMYKHPELPSNFEEIKLSDNSFLETFQAYNDYDALKHIWITSDATSSNKAKRFPVRWDLKQAYVNPGFNNDMCLAITETGPAMIARQLDQEFSLNGTSKLVLQYEVKLQKPISCGGAFIKLYPFLSRDQIEQFDPEQDYNDEMILMFGPDICIPNYDGVRLGLKKMNPLSKKSEISQMTYPPRSRLDKEFRTHLYTLILDSATQNYEIRIDGVVNYAGNLLEKGKFEPGFQSTELIPDPDDKKPTDWDDRETIDDPDSIEPSDWNENEPQYIPDPNDYKPINWDESIPEYIPDPERVQPTWWESSRDGDWIAPFIKNPSCYQANSCGQWKPKMIINQKYKGDIISPKIVNPNYKGVWKPKMINNPDFYQDKKPANFNKKIGSIVFEFLSGSKDMLIDNIYIGYDIREAEMVGNITFIPKMELEKREIELQLRKLVNIKEPMKPSINDDDELENIFDFIFDYIFEKYYLLPETVKNNIWTAFLSLFVIFVFIKVTELWGIKRTTHIQDNKKESLKTTKFIEKKEIKPND